ncbi:MAG: phospho-sugar mutase [Phycisphaerae bacterium]|jgi:phosphoglucomutase
MDQTIETAVRQWLADPVIAEQDKAEIRALLEAGDEKELADRFYRELEFGTAGLRGLIGAGLNRVNVYTVGQATQGLANHIARQGESARRAGVAIAYDCRRMSDLFARRTAEVLAANGITAYLFEQLRPTPELSFAVRYLQCAAGVVITASHNPPAYNGYKVYGADGVQIIPPQDAAIIAEVRRVGGFAHVRHMDYADGVARGLIRPILREVDEAFLQAVQTSCLDPQAVREYGPRIKIVYTALHGTGGQLIPEALRRRGFSQVLEVPEQARPDGEFPTVQSPNPEEQEALALAVKLAERVDADVVIGTDPDADRMGVAIRTPAGGYELLTGNQTGALLTWYTCENLKAAGRFPDNAAVISTIVSGDLMKEIGRGYGAEVIEVLTGFKWIGAKVAEFEAQGTPGRPSRTYLFGSEESYGYMPATYVRDKDAVTSAACFADLAATAAAHGRSIYGILEDLYRRFGCFQESALNVTLPGPEGAARIQAIMATLRGRPPRAVAGTAVQRVGDLKSGEIREAATGAVTGRYDLPASDVILLYLADGGKVIARPSGTEPKIKFYILVREPADDLPAAKARAAAKIEAIKADIVQWTKA